MPGIAHEIPVELLRANPGVAAALLVSVGVPVPAGGAAAMAPADLGSALPAELRADAVMLLGEKGSRMAVVAEVQQSRRTDKRRVWPAYLALARAQHDCHAPIQDSWKAGPTRQSPPARSVMSSPTTSKSVAAVRYLYHLPYFRTLMNVDISHSSRAERTSFAAAPHTGMSARSAAVFGSCWTSPGWPIARRQHANSSRMPSGSWK
jgi:hypothetical protein